MDKLVKRITAVRRKADGNEAVVVYNDKGTRSRKVSGWARPIERIAHRMLKSEAIAGDEALRLHEKSNTRRRDGWLHDLSINLIKAQRKGYNEARKAVPFGMLPKA
jgi:hypothetical protein